MDPHEGQEAPSAPPMCAAGCGFFGNPASENFCSKCFRDQQSNRQVSPVAPPSPVVVKSIPVPPSPSPIVATPVAAAESLSSTASPSKVKHKCFTCNKSVGLLGFVCRCENEYCAKHRHASEHACSFDYKAFDRDRLEKANPVVAASKIQQI